LTGRHPAGDIQWVDADTIARIETFPLRIPFRAGAGSAASRRAGPPAVDSLLVKVTTAEGYEGWGEALGFETAPMARQAIGEVIAPLLAGQDAMRIAPLMRALQERLHVLGRAGSLMHALSAVDIALWDIAGKAAGVPVHRLLGGGGPDLPCYASLDGCAEPALVRAAVRDALDAGFRGLKLHERDVAVVRAAREEAGPDTDLMLDVNCAWSLNQAREQAAQLAGIGLKWLEEPLWPPENYDGLARFRAACAIPVAAGENVSTLMDFDRLMGTGAVDYIQPSPAKMGGITELGKVFALAAVRNVTPVPHTFYHGPGLLAAIHVSAALGTDGTMIEWRHSDLETRVYGPALIPEHGRIRVPQGPGLGIDPDPAVLRAYLRPGADRDA
jgi:L-alanine-DL-glutamate epimerase-like enolase superfamily enzyme